MTPAWPNGDPRLIAHAIVAAPPYTTVTPPAAPPGLIEQLEDWIGQRLHDLFAAIGRLLGAEVSHATVIGGFVVAAIALLCAYAFVRLVDRWVRRRASAARARRTVARARSTSAEWIAHAADAAREERWRDAAAALVHAAFAALDETGRLPYDAARTTAEARAALADPAFDGFARDADLALFAAAATRERIERMRTALAAFGRAS